MTETTDKFITFRDLTHQKVTVNIRHIVMVICPSPLGEQASGLVVMMGGQAGVSIAVAAKLQDEITTYDIDRTEVVN